jgi:hypothetical protein
MAAFDLNQQAYDETMQELVSNTSSKQIWGPFAKWGAMCSSYS